VIRSQGGVTASKHDRVFHRGSLMFIEGEKGEEMYILKSGRIKILKQEGSKTIELATLGAGSVLGEMSLLIDMPRSATAQVVEDVLALAIDKRILEDTYSKIPPWLVSVIREVVKRLRDTMKKNTDNLVRDNMGGIINLLLLLVSDIAPDEEGRITVLLDVLKDEALYTIGLSSGDTDKIVTELILKELLVVTRTPEGREMVEVRRQDVLNLFFEYLLAHFNGKHLPGETLSAASAALAQVLVRAGREQGVRQKDGSVVLARPAVEVALGKAGQERFLNMDAVEELKMQKLLEAEEKGSDADQLSHKNLSIKFMSKKLEKALLLNEWKVAFESDS